MTIWSIVTVKLQRICVFSLWAVKKKRQTHKKSRQTIKNNVAKWPNTCIIKLWNSTLFDLSEIDRKHNSSEKLKSFTVSGWLTHCDHSRSISFTMCTNDVHAQSCWSHSYYTCSTIFLTIHPGLSWNSSQSFALFLNFFAETERFTRQREKR